MLTEMQGYICREADEKDFPGIADLLCRHDYVPDGLEWSRQKYMDWLTWKFLDNPDGPARIFVVEDSHGTVVGLRVSLPRWLSSTRTGPFLAYHGVDEFIDEKRRKKGLYSKLRHFAVDRLSATFGFSSDIIVRVALRQGYRVLGPARRWWFPVTLSGEIAGTFSGFAVPLVDTLSRFYAVFWLGNRLTDLHMKAIERFDRDYDINSELIHGVRSAAFLNWRFIGNPMYSYSAYEFFEGDESIGYCVYAVRGAKAEIYDFVVCRRNRGCMRLLVEQCRREGISHLRFRGFGLRLGRYGFIPRRDSDNNCIAASELPDGIWMLTLGDRDY